jgi:hypothetical protein
MHMENELFLRIHQEYELEMVDYGEQVTKELREMYAKL